MSHLRIPKKNKIIFPLLIDCFFYSVETMAHGQKKGKSMMRFTTFLFKSTLLGCPPHFGVHGAL